MIISTIYNNDSGSFSVGEQLLEPSDTKHFPSIVPPFVPSIGAKVTVKNPVNLRPDKLLSGDTIGIFKSGDKLIILKVDYFEKPNSNSGTIISAQVKKCNQDCNR